MGRPSPRFASLIFGSLASLLLPLHAGCGHDDNGVVDAGPALPDFHSTCTPAAPSADSQLPAGRLSDGTVILPGGRKLTPAGTVLDVGGFPLGMRVLPGDRYVAVTDGAYGYQALRLVDTQAADPHAAVVSSYEYPRTSEDAHSPGLFLGLALTKDGTRLYASNGGYDPVPDQQQGIDHYNTIDAFDLGGDPPQLVHNDAATLKLMFNPGLLHDGSALQRLPAGITLSADETLLYVACQSDDTLAIVDLASGVEIGRAALPGIGPYDVAIDETTHTAFVSLWGGEQAQKDVYIDGIDLVDVSVPAAPVAMMSPLSTGKAAEAELLLAGKLYVTNADADTLSVVDVASRTVKSTPVTAGMLLGASPNHIAVDDTAGRLYLAAAGENAVIAIDLASMTVLGRIPTAWYPTAVAVLGDGSLVIASAKGLGLGPINHAPSDDNYSYMQGVAQLVPRPSDEDLKAGDTAAAANLDRPQANQATPTCASSPGSFPLPLDGKPDSPIQHVFLIVRENKTYDAILGDLAGAAGDPTLVLFGQSVTPNLHALAHDFTLLDNFYSLAEQSLQGHEWTTAAIANDYTEKAWLTTWGRSYRSPSAFASGALQHLAMPGSDTIWTHLDRAGIPYKNYGEVVNTAGATINLDSSYPGVIFNLDVLDVDKAAYVVEQLSEPASIVPFSYIELPNDHTYGTTPGKPTPQSMVADNDLATGQFIEGLSHSPLWPTSIVFVIEDDPSDGGDHIEPHRSPALVISPWTRRGYVSHANYDIGALYRTIELLLGITPMNLNDQSAPGMYDLFSPTPDYGSYTSLPRTVPMTTNSDSAPMSEESLKIDFSKPDQAPLGRILWKATHDKDAEPPWRKMPLRWEPDRDGDGDGD